MLLRPASLALAAGLALGAPAALADTITPIAAEHVAAPTAPVASQGDATRYAAREQQDQKAADYQGGSLVVVGISGGALIVILLLLLILL